MVLTVATFDLLHAHVGAFDDRQPSYSAIGVLPWTIDHSSVAITTRDRKGRRLLRAFYTSAAGIDVVVTFTVKRGWYHNRVTFDLEIGGRDLERGVKDPIDLVHTFDRAVVARLVAEMERHAERIRSNPGEGDDVLEPTSWSGHRTS